MEIAEKSGKTYECKSCNYITCDKRDFNKHISTRKHLNNTTLDKNPNKNSEKKSEKYECKGCDYVTSNKFDYEKHCSTQKHISRQIRDKNPTENPENLECKHCNYSTKSKKDYAKHCSSQKHKNVIQITEAKMNQEYDDISIKTVVVELFKQQGVLQNILVELTKHQSITNTNSHNTTNNTQNFNLQFFLNETCKDAMNIDDFIKSLQVTMEDFQETGRLGYVEGITRIILNGLKQVDTTKRPIHCTDVKRETVYIKNQDAWEKENKEKEKLKKAVNQVARMNLSQLPKWQQENPESEVLDTKEHDEYMKLAKSALGGMGDKEEEQYVNKIMKNVMKEVTLRSASAVTYGSK